jgi:erythromycin esterase
MYRLISIVALFLFCGAVRTDDRKIIEWIKVHSYPINSLDANSSDEDLTFLSAIQEGKTAISIGEVTHGISEFATLKFRVFKYLAVHHDFKIFAIEQDYLTVEPLNQYLLTGNGEPEKILKHFIRSYANEETLQMVKWMRRFNSTIDNDLEKLKIYGFDMQRTGPILQRIKDLVAGDQSLVQLIDSIKLTQVKDFSPPTLRRDQFIKLRDAILSLHDLALPTNSTLNFFVTMLDFSQEVASTRQHHRDLYMAQIMEMIMDAEGESKTLISAHNLHVFKCCNEVDDYVTPPMGRHLHSKLANKLFTIGIDFNKGSFWAVKVFSRDSIATQKFTLPDAPPHSLPYVFSQTGTDIFFLNLEPTTRDSLANNWFSGRKTMRTIGASFDERITNEQSTDPITVKEWYDGLLFFNEVHECQLLAPVGTY